MAISPDPVSKSVFELELEITCGICHEHYQEPKILPCGHYYCKGCILQVMSKPNKPFPCPDCREPTQLPGNNPDGLTTAFFISRLKELYLKMKKGSLEKVESSCEQCSGGKKAVAFCRQCAHFICDECVNSHKRMKTFTGHVVSTLSTQSVQDMPVPFYRYFNGREHFYTTNADEIGTTTHGDLGRHKYRSEGTQCTIYNTQVPGTVPFYRYFNGNDHFYTTNPSEIGTTVPGVIGKHGYKSEGIAGYSHPHQQSPHVPLYRGFSKSNGNHFYTTNEDEMAKSGYSFEGIACYVGKV